MSYLDERRQHIFNSRPLKIKNKKSIAKKSAKRIEKEKDQKEIGTNSALNLWFKARRKEMKGICALCGGKTEKHNDHTYRYSIHHLLDKRPAMFPSVSCHDDNWLELCYYGNSCHANIHNNTISWELLYDSAEWKIIVEKFRNIYPFIVEKEKKNIPELLLKELNQ